MKKTLTLFSLQLKREWLLQVRDPKIILQAALFFIMITVFFPLSLPADNVLLAAVTPGIIWIAMLLSMLLSAVYFFQQDYEDGIIEQWIISPYSLTVYVIAKLLVHWLLNLVPLLIFCPLLALLFNLNVEQTAILICTVLIGSPAILFLCGLASAFNAGIQQKGILMALILLPLTIPIMVFGSGILTLAMQQLPFYGNLAILAAISLLALSFLPLAIAAVLRINLSD
ncbi:MAG: heme exporter protein CcmB [Proteobacteria bacterium]|nr:heme exporter protein CcmB [Pseudomonadota bacterium]